MSDDAIDFAPFLRLLTIECGFRCSIGKVSRLRGIFSADKLVDGLLRSMAESRARRVFLGNAAEGFARHFLQEAGLA